MASREPTALQREDSINTAIHVDIADEGVPSFPAAVLCDSELDTSGMRAAFQQIALCLTDMQSSEQQSPEAKEHDRTTITFEELQAFVNMYTTLNAAPHELRSLFRFLDLDGEGHVDVDEFVWGLQNSSALRQIARARVPKPYVWGLHQYDFSRATRDVYASELASVVARRSGAAEHQAGGSAPTKHATEKKDGGDGKETAAASSKAAPPECLAHEFRASRLLVDHAYHGVYSLQRQEWQDDVLHDVCSRGEEGRDGRLWCVVTPFATWGCGRDASGMAAVMSSCSIPSIPSSSTVTHPTVALILHLASQVRLHRGRDGRWQGFRAALAERQGLLSV
jgi:hypothetical protein